MSSIDKASNMLEALFFYPFTNLFDAFQVSA